LFEIFTDLFLTRLGVLAPNGYCCPFDKDATGYTRSEAICVVFLQKAKDANRCYANFIYSKANCDGYKEEGITYPSGKMQKRLLQEFYEDLSINPSIVDYVEAHSTGTIVGDPEECRAIDEVFCADRTESLPVGSVKSNMGHSESTSGVCSLSKVIHIFENMKIPANINYNIHRPGIESLESGRLRVVTDTEEFKGNLISINSFGFGGGNAHALFSGHRKEKINKGIPKDDLPRLVVWSGRTELAVNNVIDSVKKQPLDAEYVGLLHSCMSGGSIQANIYRGYGVFSQNGNEENATCISRGAQHYIGYRRPVVWVYSGMGSQWCGMGTDLMRIPIFAESIEKSHKILAYRGLNLKQIITSEDPKMFDNILHSFVGIAAIQIALTDVLKTLGLEPDHIIGHSVGELGCAYADGCFTAEEMILSSYSRGMASLETKTVFGSMAAVGLGYKKLKSMVPEGIEIACHNSSDSSTISGPAELVANFVAELKSKNIFAKEVASNNIPYHSKYIKGMGPNLLNRLQQVIKEPKKRSPRWLCSSVPKNRWDTEEASYSSPEYHTNNLLSPVLFEETAVFIPRDAMTVEIAPHSLLQAILKKSMPEAFHVGLTRRENKQNSNFFLNSLGIMYENGIDFDVSKLYPPVEFPVSRGTPFISPLIDWEHSEDWFVTRFENQKGNRSGERHIVMNLSDLDHEYITGHTIDGRILFPATAYVQLVWETLGLVMGVYYFELKVEFEDVKFLRATAVPKNQDIDFTVMIQPGSGKFEITEANSTLVTGIVRVVDRIKLVDLERPKDNGFPTLIKKDFYKELRLRGYHYNGLFKSVEEARCDGILAKVKWNPVNWVSFMDCLLQVHIIGQDTRGLLLPTGIQKILIDPEVHKQCLNGDLENSDIAVDVYSDKALNILRAGGIEIRGLQASVVGRRKPQGFPVLETYQFISHLPTPYLSRSEMTRFCVQIALENLPTSKVLSIEIDENDDKQPLSELYGIALGDLPLVTAELNYLTSKTDLELGAANVENNCNFKSYKNCLFITKSNCLSNDEFLGAVCLHLCDGGFLISRESNDLSFKVLANLPKVYKVIAIVPSDNETIVMMQYHKKELKSVEKIIQINSTTFEWLDELKEEIKKGPVIAYSQNDETSGIIGLVNCIRKEPNGTNLRCVFINDQDAPPFDLESYFYKNQLQLGIAVNVYKNGQWGSYKHFLLTQTIESFSRVDHCYANCLVKGDLSSMTWLDGPYNYCKPERELAKVTYASLNFRDVMLATGKLTGDVTAIGRLDQLCVMGFEYSGIIESTKKRIMGMVISGAMSTHIEPDETLTWNCPEQWTLEEAATVPVVYGTVYASFFLTTQIEEGKSILIHAGTGGVGLAAIRVALAYGLEVFTTVSTEEKKNYLLSEFPDLQAENIGNSRDCSFEDLVMTRTNGKGVDYVLNSLADDKLQASIRCLGKGGVFLEIGKFDMANDSKIGLGNFLKELSFHSVLVDNLLRSSPEAKMRLQVLLENDMKRGIIKPLKTTVFEANQVEQAFRFLASAKHMGKVLLKIRENENENASLPITVVPRVYCSPRMSYIIPGGLGGFGLELADWLVLRGCKKLVLSSSRGITKQYQAYRIK
jgi:fatty acid synthase, animal type